MTSPEKIMLTIVEKHFFTLINEGNRHVFPFSISNLDLSRNISSGMGTETLKF